MPMRNRAEVPRLVMEEAGCPYELDVIGFQLWRRRVKEADASLPFGKLPVLYATDAAFRDAAGDALAIGNETAITRFLARQLGMAGRDAAHEARLDALYVQYYHTLRNSGVSHEGEHYSVGALRKCGSGGIGDGSHGGGVTLTRSTAPTYRSMPRANDFSVAERSLAALGVFEEQLERSATPFLAGSDSPSYVDIAIFCELFELAELGNIPDFATRFELPRLGAFLHMMVERPRIAAYIRSPRRMPRYDRPGYTYCSGKYSPKP